MAWAGVADFGEGQLVLQVARVPYPFHVCCASSCSLAVVLQPTCLTLEPHTSPLRHFARWGCSACRQHAYPLSKHDNICSLIMKVSA